MPKEASINILQRRISMIFTALPTLCPPSFNSTILTQQMISNCLIMYNEGSFKVSKSLDYAKYIFGADDGMHTVAYMTISMTHHRTLWLFGSKHEFINKFRTTNCILSWQTYQCTSNKQSLSSMMAEK